MPKRSGSRSEHSTPVTNATLCIDPYMTQMGHGASVQATAALQADGTWQISPLDMVMPGIWSVNITVCSPGATCRLQGQTALCEAPLGADGGVKTLDTSSFAFCVH